SLSRLAEDNTGFYQAKLMTARFFLNRLLPQTDSLAAAIASGSRNMMEFPDQAF
ncbi:MAG: acyl-CoA dehydrogenase C-terminal domain-containing protein, partial [Alphaproteobacteria bacterium]|nr:acyl-CoA dehydrogenase C-terminal domain-containing protein [Alphaproteobacteria bacterium]